MLQGAVALVVALAAAAGCGTSDAGEKPQPVTRHLVYEKLGKDAGVWIADAGGSRPRLLIRGAGTPAISPDGQTIAYLDECSPATARCTLYVAPTSGGKPKRLAGGIYGPVSWSPDSERLAAVQASLPANSALINVDVADGDEVTLATGELYGSSFSPDGSRIAFAAAREPSKTGFLEDSTIDLFVVASEGGEPERITDDGKSGYPAWGPKGIAYAKLIPYKGWGRHEIWRIDPDGSHRASVTGPLPERYLGQGYMGLIPVDWSADGTALLAGWLNEWGTIAVAVDPGTGKIWDIGGASTTVSISDDGQSVLVHAGSNTGGPPEQETVRIYPYEGGEPTLEITHATNPTWNR